MSDRLTKAHSRARFITSMICTVLSLMAAILIVVNLALGTSASTFLAGHEFRGQLLTIIGVAVVVQLCLLWTSNLVQDNRVLWSVAIVALQAVIMPFFTFSVIWKEYKLVTSQMVKTAN